MAVPPSAIALEDLGDRPFAFFPPIVNIEHNEWRMKRAEWSEVLVENPAMAIEIWVPRTWLGEISKVEEPHLIVGLKREFEYKAGALVPHHKKVIGMPAPHLPPPLPMREVPRKPSMAEELRAPSGPETKLAKGLMAALAVALVLITLAVGLSRLRNAGGDVRFQAMEQRDLSFTSDTTYFDVVRKLGSPEEDRWKPGGGERRLRAMVYQKEGLVILLMGPEQNDTARYIGAKDLSWRTVHTVQLPGGRTTDATMAMIQKF